MFFRKGDDLRKADGQIYVWSSDGTGLRQLTTSGGFGADSAWSPDGKKIVYVGTDSDIFTMNTDGTDVTRLTHAGQVDLSPAWSHDGKRIAFVRGLNRGISAVYVMNVDGSNVIRLSQGSEPWDQNPVWLPGDQAIAFASYAGGGLTHYVIWAINLDGSNQRQLFSDPNWNYLALAPAPDGRRFAVDGWEENQSFTTCCQIFLLGAGQSPVQLTQQHGNHPRWSPDGKEIAFDTTREGPHRIYVMNADGSDQRAVPTGAAPNQNDYLIDWALA